MKPNALNTLCAHPVAISWLLGALTLNLAVFYLLSEEAPVSTWNFGPAAIVFFAATLLGYFLGMFTCWPWVRVACSVFNGAPVAVGDDVYVLSGSHRGVITKVYEKTVGQGGWMLAKLEIGSESKMKFTDIFEEYSVMKIRREPR